MRNDSSAEAGRYYVGSRLALAPEVKNEELRKIAEMYQNGTTEEKKDALEKMYGILYCYAVRMLESTYADFFSKYAEDLISCCLLGIAEGMKKYDPEKGRPTTWFRPYMIHECELFIGSQVTHLTQHYISIDRKEKNGAAVPEESARVLSEMRGRKPVSFESDPVLSRLGSEDLNPEERYLEKAEKEELKRAIDSDLSEREKFVVIHSYGLYGERKEKNREIARAAGISADSVSHIKKRAVGKLKGIMLNS